MPWVSGHGLRATKHTPYKPYHPHWFLYPTVTDIKDWMLFLKNHSSHFILKFALYKTTREKSLKGKQGQGVREWGMVKGEEEDQETKSPPTPSWGPSRD